MTEADAREWIRSRYGVSRETRLHQFVDLVRDESERQNLVSATSLGDIWTRHILDSAQLVPLAPAEGLWMDVGTGAGFPGFVVALLRDQPTVLIEPRRRRAEFLSAAATSLGAAYVSVLTSKVEGTQGQAAVISARAVSGIEMIFSAAAAWNAPETLWLLPRGRNGSEELAVARKLWQGSFHVEQSLTSPESIVVVAKGVQRR